MSKVLVKIVGRKMKYLGNYAKDRPAIWFTRDAIHLVDKEVLNPTFMVVLKPEEAIPTPLPNQMTNATSVTTKGASDDIVVVKGVGDGVTDDSQAVQTAMKSVEKPEKRQRRMK